MHWGKEFYMQPMNSQLRIAKELRSLGSHVIIGSHSHVLQPHCYHDSDVVAFSLGNFQYAWFVPGGNVSALLAVQALLNDFASHAYIHTHARTRTHTHTHVQ